MFITEKASGMHKVNFQGKTDMSLTGTGRTSQIENYIYALKSGHNQTANRVPEANQNMNK